MTTLAGHRDAVLCVDVSPDGSLAASGSEDCTARVWDLRARRSARCVAGDALGGEPVAAVRFHPRRPHELLLAAGRAVLSFDLRRPEVLLQEPLARLHEAADDVGDLDVHGKKDLLAVADDSGEVAVVDLAPGAGGAACKRLARGGHTNVCSAARFRPRAAWDLLSGALDCRLLHWDFGRGRAAHEAAMGELDLDAGGGSQMFNPPFVYSVAWAPSGRFYAAALGDGSVVHFEQRSRQLLARFQGHRAMAPHVHYRGEDRLVSLGNDRRMLVWPAVRSREEEAPAAPLASFELPALPNWAASVGTSVLVATVEPEVLVLDLGQEAGVVGVAGGAAVVAGEAAGATADLPRPPSGSE